MPKFVFMPPQDELKEMFAARLSDTLPEYDIVSPETDEQAIEAIFEPAGTPARRH